MKSMMKSAVVLGLAALLGVACGTYDGDNSGETVVSAPEQASEPRREVQVREQAAFESGLAAEGEAFAQPVPPELERQLEAGYQASLQQHRDEKALPDLVEHHAPVNFEALFEKIRTTMPPARGVLLMQYVAATERVSDPDERMALLNRLSSPELNNVRRAQ